MAYDGLHDVFTDQPMGALTEQRNDVDQFTRAEQDEFAARSHQLAAAAWKDGVFADEVVPVSIPQRKGDPIEFTEDEGIRANTTAESLAGLKPAFRKDGTITAGSASQISDGACAVVVMNKAKAEELGLSWLCEIGAHGVVAGPGLDAAEPARERDQEGDRQGGHHRRPARRHRDQRGVRRGGAGVGQGTRHRPGPRSTPAAAPSPSATRSGCPVPGSPCTPRSNWPEGLGLRRGRALRCRRPGRRADPAPALTARSGDNDAV